MKVMVASRSCLLREAGCYEKLVATVHRKLQDAKEVVKLRSKKCSELSSDYFKILCAFLSMNRTTFKHCFDKQDCLNL